MIERDAEIDDADRHAAAVPRRMRRGELRGAGFADRQVRLLRGVAALGGACGTSGAMHLAPGADRAAVRASSTSTALHGGERCDGLHLADGNTGSQIAEASSRNWIWPPRREMSLTA